MFALNQWEDYSICRSDAILLEKLHARSGNTPLLLCGLPRRGAGATAYIGLHEVGQIQSGPDSRSKRRSRRDRQHGRADR